MADVTLGADRTLTVSASVVTNITLPFHVRYLEITKKNEPAFYLKVDSAVETGSLDEARFIDADILSFDVKNEPTQTAGSVGIDHPFSLISLYSTSEFTVKFINMTAAANA